MACTENKLDAATAHRNAVASWEREKLMGLQFSDLSTLQDLQQYVNFKQIKVLTVYYNEGWICIMTNGSLTIYGPASHSITEAIKGTIQGFEKQSEECKSCPEKHACGLSSGKNTGTN